MNLNNEETFYVQRMWSFSRALDLALVDEEIEQGLQLTLGRQHGERVAYISFCLGRQLGLKREELVQLLVAGLLHDIGAVGGFRSYHGDHRLMIEHCQLGAGILERFPKGKILANAVLYHHETPNPIYGALGAETRKIPLLGKILAVADRVDVNLARHYHGQKERQRLLKGMEEKNGILFFPEITEAFKAVARREAFWIDLEQTDLQQITSELLFGRYAGLLPQKLEGAFIRYLAETFADLIDQKSEFTARHSRYVSEVVAKLAEGLGWDEEKIQEIRLAGLLHDLGKLAVPKKVLDKPGKLDSGEIEMIRKHTYYTFRLLREAGFPKHVVHWAAYHHERLDGSGYPFAMTQKSLDTGARLMTIADIFAALTEERPYRKALKPQEALELMGQGAGVTVDARLLKSAEKILL